MYFNAKKTAFSRHESFSLRFGWLTKGIREFDENKNIFSDPDAVVKLGVGKNMVNSIRHWLRASQLISLKGHAISPIGDAIFSKENGWDPFLEDEATIWLIHWLIATNSEHATTWYWFFNHFHKPEFTSEEVSNALVQFVKEKVDGRVAVSSVKQDVNVLLRSYSQSKKTTKTGYEDALDSPLSLLKLVSYVPATKSYRSLLETRNSLSIGIFGYAICDMLARLGESQIPIEDLIYCKEGNVAPALVFRLTENELLTKLEQLIQLYPESFQIDQTAGIHQFFILKQVDPMDLLRMHYEPQCESECI